MKAILILDNLRIHRAKEVNDLIKTHKNLSFLFLPPYSSNFNAIEKLWQITKHYWRKFLVANSLLKLREEDVIS